jgi:hypothetical protein
MKTGRPCGMGKVRRPAGTVQYSGLSGKKAGEPTDFHGFPVPCFCCIILLITGK